MYGGALLASLAWFALRRFGLRPVVGSPAAGRPVG
jgi:hypothetical protein